MRFVFPNAGCILLALCLPAAGLTINADFSRDIVNGTNPSSNPEPVLYAGTGPAPDTGTLWNDLQVPLSATGDSGANSISHPLLYSNLVASNGAATTIGIQLTSGFTSSFNSASTLFSSVTSLQNDRVFPSLGALATLKIQGLDPTRRYTLYLIGASGFSTAFTVNSSTKVAAGTIYDGAWTEGGEHVTFTSVAPSPAGEITVQVQDGTAPIDSFGVLSGLQIAEAPPARFLYANGVSTTGGEFSATYPPTNLMNDGFTSPTDPIDTRVTYPASGNNYATAGGKSGNFDLTFDFAQACDIDGMHVWNYTYRASNGGGVTTPGVNSYTLTFRDGAGGSGSTVGSVFSGNLAEAKLNAINLAESVYFPATYGNVRSVVMHVVSNHGGSYTGMAELAFNGATNVATSSINTFSASAPFVQRPATPALSWSVSGTVTSLSISPGIGDVMPLTVDGAGSIPVSPLGEQTYTLTLNGTITQTVSVVGLPPKDKVHLYLFIGQSNMQGAGSPYSATLDAPVPRVVKFGSRTGMEPVFVKGGHNLTGLATTNSGVGMGIEFGKTILAAQSDPEVVIGIINHALGSSAIEWWAPGVQDNKQINPQTNLNYYLYDEAVQRVNAASQYGVLKGVLWHQGEYNCGTNTDPASDPNGYAARIQALVTNLRNSFNNPSLPFVCGKFVPATWTYADGSPGAFNGLPYRSIVEGAMTDLPNHRTNTFCVNNDGLRGRSDQLIHFDAYSQRLLGQRYANAVLGFYADPYRLYLGGFLTPTELADPQVTDPLGDFDHDGISNFLEYAFLTNPKQPQTIQPVSYANVNVPGEGDFPAISFRQRFDAEAPQYVVQVSGDLTTWTSNLDGPTAVTEMVGSPVDNGDGTFTTTVRVLAPPAPCFLRVRASQP